MTGMRGMGPVIGQHGATVIALHEHLMLFIAAHVGQQRTDEVRRCGARSLGRCASYLAGHAGVNGRAGDRSYGRSDRDQEGGFRHLAVPF